MRAVRDPETAEIAVRAAQVGRLVLSTLHTNSAEGALRRLVDLSVPEFLARDVLRGVLGQRLVVVSCPDCGGEGCGACRGSGAVGRRSCGLGEGGGKKCSDMDELGFFE